MAFPAGWPPRVPSGIRSIRVYVAGTATASYADNAYLFSQVTSANTFQPLPYVAPGTESAAPGWTAASVPVPPVGGGQNANDSDPDPRLNPGIPPAPPPAATPAFPPPPVPMIWAKVIKIRNIDLVNPLFISFDGTHDQGQIQPNTTAFYWDRYEAGVALKGNGNFVLEAW